MISDVAAEKTRQQCWFPLRVTYSRELKVRDILICAGLECYVPMIVRVGFRNGVEYRKDVPAVSNLCFVRSFRKELDDILVSGGMRSYVSYIWDRCTRNPVVVPDKAMADFIKVSEARMEDVIYLYEVSSRLRTGQKVRVKDGPFAGVEGVVVRVRRSRRVMVELPDMLAVATSYIPECDLEKI